jgi:hypothetical protein
MTGTEIVAWLVLAFSDGPIACFKRRSIGFRGARVEARGWVCRHSQQEGTTLYVVRRSMGRD